jgi:energy-coupling factor transporter ATP-binding protein EcfA2
MAAGRWLALTGASAVPLADELRRACGRLSKGQLQRVALAGPLHGATQRPAVLVLDEPWAGLDPQARSQLGDDLVAAAQRGSAIVCTDHTGAAPLRASRTLRLAGDDTEPPAGPRVRIELARDGARAIVVVDEPELAALLRDGWEIRRGEASP